MAPNGNAFNPYHTWLGLDRSVTRPNHYQLLGIDQHERDPRRIAAAAERATTRVRGFRPGSRSAQWAKLLDEINAARACLVDPAQRAQYDRQLATPATAARSFSRPAPRGSATTPGAVPMGAPPQSGAPAAPTRAVPMSLPTATPTHPGGPHTGTPNAAASHPGGNVPSGIPVGAVVSGAPATPTPSSPGMTSQTSTVAASRQARRSLTSPIILALAACLVLFGIILLMLFAGGEPDKEPTVQPPQLSKSRPVLDSPRPESRTEPKRPSAAPPTSSTREYSAEQDSAVAEQEGLPDVVPGSKQASGEEPWSLPAFPKLDTSLAPKPNTVPPTDVTPASPEASGPNDEPTAPKPEAIDVAEPGIEPSPEPVSPDAATGPRPEDLAALAAAMKAARTATFEGKFDAALNELNKVASVPKSSEHRAMYDRLTLLAQYARNFRSALSESIATLEPGDEIELGASTVVGVVGTSAGKITVRSQGRNKTYTVDTLPPGLAVAIADTWLRQDDPVTLVMKGAYLATLKDADAERLAKARQWLQEASSRGLDTEDLEKVLDDTYDFAADIDK